MPSTAARQTSQEVPGSHDAQAAPALLPTCPPPLSPGHSVCRTRRSLSPLLSSEGSRGDSTSAAAHQLHKCVMRVLAAVLRDGGGRLAWCVHGQNVAWGEKHESAALLRPLFAYQGKR